MIGRVRATRGILSITCGLVFFAGGCTWHKLGLEPGLLPEQNAAIFLNSCANYQFAAMPGNIIEGDEEADIDAFGQEVIDLLSERVLQAGVDCPLTIVIKASWNAVYKEATSNWYVLNPFSDSCCIVSLSEGRRTTTKRERDARSKAKAKITVAFFATASKKKLGVYKGFFVSSGAVTTFGKSGKPIQTVLTRAFEEALRDIHKDRIKLFKAFRKVISKAR